FAAVEREIDGQTIGVIRVYESADTPHIVTATGAIYIREVAEDKEHGKRLYRPREIASQQLLLELATRGERARERVEARFAPSACPFVDETLGLRYDHAVQESVREVRLIQVPTEPAIVVRLSPLTVTSRFRDVAVSAKAFVACQEVGAALTDGGSVAPGDIRTNAQGIS